MKQVKNALSSQFNVKDLGDLHYFLGVKVEQYKDGSIWIGQPTYTSNILEKFGMKEAKPMGTPVSTDLKLVKAKDSDELFDEATFRSAVGSLQYLSTMTRPDITYAVSNVAKFCAKPTNQEHWTAVKRIVRYLKGTSNHGLLYKPQSSVDSSSVVGFSDADWAGDINDRKSTSGYVFQIGGTAVSWRSKKQKTVALSTCEAEYIALSQTHMHQKKLSGSDNCLLIYVVNC